MNTAAWSYVLSVMGFAIMWLAGNKRWEAWVLGLINQAIWVAYAIATRQYGFLFGAGVYGTVYARNLRKWFREQRLACGLMSVEDVRAIEGA